MTHYNSVAIIIPYFGKFPNYFNLFLMSCGYNSDIDFIIFTDDKSLYLYPKNVFVHYCSFEDTKKMIQSNFDFQISIVNPYKLCDYKPAYGLIFKKFLKNYDFWGYCDVDLIFGNIRQLVTEDILNKYDKIFSRGHLCLIRNNEKLVNMFMNTFNEKLLYKEVFQDINNRTFDEKWSINGGGINGIFQKNNIKIYNEPILADIKINYHNHRLTCDKTNKYNNCIFIYKNGEIIRMISLNKKIISEKYIYIHFQKRKMQIDELELANPISFMIIPNKFINYNPRLISNENLKIYNKSKLIYYPYIKLRYNNLKKKVISYLRLG